MGVSERNLLAARNIMDEVAYQKVWHACAVQDVHSWACSSPLFAPACEPSSISGSCDAPESELQPGQHKHWVSILLKVLNNVSACTPWTRSHAERCEIGALK